MGNRRKGLFVFFEGLADTVIDSQVMVHAREMRFNGIVDFEIWSFACFYDLYERSKTKVKQTQDISGCRVRVFRGIRPAIPFSCIANALLVCRQIQLSNIQFGFIHARTEYTAAVCSYLKLFKKFDLIWDCRGDSEAEVSDRLSSQDIYKKLFAWCQRYNLRWRVWVASKACQKALFVSNPLRKAKGYNLETKKTVQVIPSTASRKIFFYDPHLRRSMRKKLGFTENDKVLIYSGGMATYQLFPETVALFQDLHSQNRNFKLLVLTPERGTALQFLKGLKQGAYQIFSVRFYQVNSFFNAADFAVMLRKHSPINSAASPTKFAEYCLTGLPVIMNDSVPDAYELGRKIGNICMYHKGKCSLLVNNDREKIMIEYRKILSRESANEIYRSFYLSAIGHE